MDEQTTWPEVKAQLKALVKAKLEDQSISLHEYIRCRTLVEGFIKQWEEVQNDQIRTESL